MIPNGRLLIIGGAEDKGPIRVRPEIKIKNKNFIDYDILSRIIPTSDKGIEIITTASQQPIKTGNMYVRSFKKAGYKNVAFMNIDSKTALQDPNLIPRIKNAGTVFFSGGDQFRLTSILGDSELLRVIFNRYLEDESFLLAGTSAGAMAMGDTMIYHAENNEAMLKGHVKITRGFGLLHNTAIDTHFVKRGRFVRLAQAIIMNPDCLGIGLGEDTGMIITKGSDAECIGSGNVIIIDGKNMSNHNHSEAEDDQPLHVEGLKVHLLSSGNRFSLKKKKFLKHKD
jgi:cyanophycinase